MTLNVRPFIPQDNSQGVALYIDTFSQEPWNETLDPQTIEQHFVRMQRMNTQICYALENDGKLVGIALGFIRTWYLGVEYHMDTFCISPHAQGKGFGTFFLKEIKQNLLKQDIDTIILDADRNSLAQEFYLKNGFSNLDDSINIAISFS